MQDFLVALRLCPGALFLRPDSFAQMRDSPRPFLKGLILVVGVAIVLALVAVVGETLEWATIPDMGAIQATVLRGIQQMPWYQEARRASPEFEGVFRQQYEMGWRFFPYLFGAPHPFLAAVRVMLTPLGFAVSWLAFSVAAFVFARLLGGRASLGQTLGCTALAVSPQLLGLLRLLPYVEMGWVLTLWTLLGNYLAIKTANSLTSNRAFWATVLPFIVVAVIVAVLGVLGAVLGPTLLRGGR